MSTWRWLAGKSTSSMEVSSWKINCFCGRLSIKPWGNPWKPAVFSWETVTDAEPQNPGFRMGQALSIPGIPWAISYICILSHGGKHVGQVCDIHKVKKSQSPLPRTETLGEPAPLPWSLRWLYCYWLGFEPCLLLRECEYIVPVADGFFNDF